LGEEEEEEEERGGEKRNAISTILEVV